MDIVSLSRYKYASFRIKKLNGNERTCEQLTERNIVERKFNCGLLFASNRVEAVHMMIIITRNAHAVYGTRIDIQMNGNKPHTRTLKPPAINILSVVDGERRAPLSGA